MTHWTLAASLMFLSGSPETRMRSASLPGSRVPRSLERPRALAGMLVAVSSACQGRAAVLHLGAQVEVEAGGGEIEGRVGAGEDDAALVEHGGDGGSPRL